MSLNLLPLKRLAWLAALTMAPLTASAQSSTLTVVVPYPAGGSVDTVARIMSDKLRDALGQPVVVENRPGAGGRLAVASVKNGPTDGSVVVITPNGLSTVQSLVHAGKLPYDMQRDFTPVAKLVSFPLSLAVPVSSNVRTAQDMVTWAKANPNAASYGSSGAGGMAHFAGLLFAKAADINWTHVPYKGGAPLINDLSGGHIPAGVDALADHIEHHRAGRIRVLGTFSQARSPLAPEVPTLAEQGVTGISAEGWFGMFMHASAPAAAVTRVQDAVGKVLQDADIQARLGKMVLKVDYTPSAAFREIVQRDFETWGPAVRDSGFKPE